MCSLEVARWRFPADVRSILAFEVDTRMLFPFKERIFKRHPAIRAFQPHRFALLRIRQINANMSVGSPAGDRAYMIIHVDASVGSFNIQRAFAVVDTNRSVRGANASGSIQIACFHVAIGTNDPIQLHTPWHVNRIPRSHISVRSAGTNRTNLDPVRGLLDIYTGCLQKIFASRHILRP